MRDKVNSIEEVDIWKMPIQIYLDSSDYSVLSNPQTRDERVEQTKVQLLSYLDRGDIEIRYSSIHVFEMAHISLENRDLSLKRFEVLEELCRKKALIYMPNMENIEISLLAKGVENFFDVQTIANDEGQWIPNLTSEQKGFNKFILDQLSMALKKMGTPRRQRIGIEKKIFKRDRLTDFGFQLISQNRDSLNEALSVRFPLTEKFWKEDFLLQFLRGKIAESQLLDELQRGFTDPTNFIGWYINRDKKGLGIPKQFRDVSATNIDKLRVLQDQYQKLHDLGIQAHKSEKELQQNIKHLKNKMIRDLETFRKRYLTKIWDERQQELLKLGVTKKLWNSNVKSSIFGQTPSIDFYFHSLLTYMMNSVSNPKNSRKLSNSDHVDLMHGRYLPYVDIFRADRFMGNLLSPIAKGYKTKIVISFLKLPDVIETCLTKKNKVRCLH